MAASLYREIYSSKHFVQKAASTIPGLQSPDVEDNLLYTNPVNGYIQNEWSVGLPAATGVPVEECKRHQEGQVPFFFTL